MGMVKEFYDEQVQEMEERIQNLERLNELYYNEIQEMAERNQDLESQSAFEGEYIERLETELDGLETELEDLAYAIDRVWKEFQAVSGRIAGRIAMAQERRDGR